MPTRLRFPLTSVWTCGVILSAWLLRGFARLRDGGAIGRTYLNWNLDDGIGADPDPAAAQAACRKNCDLGEAAACARLEDGGE